jgi:2-Cys peroxiredoxin 5
MASNIVLRRLALNASLTPSRSFHSTALAYIKVGDSIPTVEGLVESSPGNKVNLSEQIKKGKSLIIGVPAAFSKVHRTHFPKPLTDLKPRPFLQ